MEKEPSDKLRGMQCHYLFFVTVGVITPEERYFIILKLDNTVIADSYPVGIPTEVLKDSFDTVKWRFAVDHPLLMVELFSEAIRRYRVPWMTKSVKGMDHLIHNVLR
jgi:hypothetical protein